jgi:hypothetical protein
MAVRSVLDYLGETFAGLYAGRQYDKDVLIAYQRAGGMRP